ncbi:MAG TPA: hypothetical protein DCP37_13160 [Dehalococcoidia bacterium]|jgi:hypothetical protein|nr:hypothetical protein [SAR202 cluster bacterium]HAL48695.1 hypothetical protein [Dehalococcoidia bacterium]|tara:strand:- start:1871 stop:2335 length:465 start_codon:yes stop_codon:yes gene_type:complete
MAFEDRIYKLGETIDIDLELTARRDVVIREGRVDLMCRERYTRTHTVTVQEQKRPGMGAGAGAMGPPAVGSKQATKTEDESYSHSGAVVLNNTSLQPGETNSHQIKLEIDSEPPHHMADSSVTEAEVRWELVATFDVAQAVDVAERQPIRVALV